MPRKLRCFQPHTNYHLISRFVNREWFIASAAERSVYLHYLGEALERSDWRCLGYGVMSNHIHLDVMSGNTTIASWLRDPHSLFADWINKRHDRIGAVFVRGPTMHTVSADHFATVLAYVHNNPVRAGVVAEPAATIWTSHRAYLGLDPAPSWLHVEEGLERAKLTRDELDAWVRTKPNERAVPELAELQRKARKRNGTEPKAKAPPSADKIADAVVRELGISRDELCSRGISPMQVHARRAMIRAATEFGVSNRAIAEVLTLTQRSVTRIHSEVDAESLEVSANVVASLRAA